MPNPNSLLERSLPVRASVDQRQYCYCLRSDLSGLNLILSDRDLRIISNTTMQCSILLQKLEGLKH